MFHEILHSAAMSREYENPKWGQNMEDDHMYKKLVERQQKAPAATREKFIPVHPGALARAYMPDTSQSTEDNYKNPRAFLPKLPDEKHEFVYFSAANTGAHWVTVFWHSTARVLYYAENVKDDTCPSGQPDFLRRGARVMDEIVHFFRLKSWVVKPESKRWLGDNSCHFAVVCDYENIVQQVGLGDIMPIQLGEYYQGLPTSKVHVKESSTRLRALRKTMFKCATSDEPVPKEVVEQWNKWFRWAYRRLQLEGAPKRPFDRFRQELLLDEMASKICSVIKSADFDDLEGKWSPTAAWDRLCREQRQLAAAAAAKNTTTAPAVYLASPLQFPLQARPRPNPKRTRTRL